MSRAAHGFRPWTPDRHVREPGFGGHHEFGSSPTPGPQFECGLAVAGLDCQP